jgi:very-short-patch-repair endonuclease
MKPIEDKVLHFTAKAAGVVGDMCGQILYRDILDSIEENDIESPIERIFYSALLCFIKYAELPEEDILTTCDSKHFLFGIKIISQYEIGKYKVDFLIRWSKIEKGAQKTKELIVECDSQEWHERTESERRYEKKRDRYLAKKGYTVYHFTGKEIIENPIKVAADTIHFFYDGTPLETEYEAFHEDFLGAN